MITLEAATATISADISKVSLKCQAGAKRGGIHLGHKYSTPDAKHPTTPDDSPVNITGRVELSVDTTDERDEVLGEDWFFGFIQVARVKRVAASWEGRRKGEGSVDLTVVGFPVSGDVVALDSDPANQPFYLKQAHVGTSTAPQGDGRRRVRVVASMGDHPNYRDELVANNSVTKTKNFLHELFYNIEFTTVFVARELAGPVQKLAHLTWTLDLQGEFKWTSGSPKGFTRSAPVLVTPSKAGPPLDPQVREIVTNPDGKPLAKDMVISAWRNALKNPRMMVSSAERSLLLPPDFFR